MDFIQNIDWMQLLRCFVVGGIICIIGQVLIDKTKLTPARTLVVFVTAGAILGGLGIYKYLIDFVIVFCFLDKSRLFSLKNFKSFFFAI